MNPRALWLFALIACGGDKDVADDTPMDGDADTDTDSDSDTDTDTDTDPVALPEGYAFASRDGTGADSVSNPGQQFRHVLIADLKSYLSGLTDDLNGGRFPVAGEIASDLSFYFEFDSASSGTVNHSVSTTPPTLQTTYDDISSDKDLVGKLAGNDAVTDHRDWSTEFAGWPSAGSPEALIRQWFDEIDAAAVAWSLGTFPQTPSGVPVAKVFVTEQGQDLQQLVDKLLRVGIAFSQGTDDYLDDDVKGKGLLADHSALSDGENYTALEHAWDEGFGYFGAARNFGAWTHAERIDAAVDDNGDGAIDLLIEKTWHSANNAGKRDDASVTGTTYGDQAYDAFFAGRQLLASATTTLTPAELDELRGHRDAAVAAWESVLAATVVHYLNEVVADADRIGDPKYSFEDHAKHWSEAKGFALGFQFNPHSPMTDQQFDQLHAALGTKPAIETDGLAAIAQYSAGLLDARDLLQTIYGFDPADAAAW